MADKADYYDLLGVAKDADAAALKRAFREKAIKYHPDRNDAPDAEEQFKAVNEAYAVLSDPDKRAHYDRFGHDAPGLSGGSPFGGGFDGNLRDIFGGDLFEQLFGGFMRGGNARHGQDIEVKLSLTLIEASEGGEKAVEFRRRETCQICGGSGAEPGTRPIKCPTCGGMGRVRIQRGFIVMPQACPECNGRGKIFPSPCSGCDGSCVTMADVTVRIPVPPGIADTNRLRVDGEGHAGHEGGMHGDLYVHVSVLDHPLFERDGDDLICEVPITFPQATLGTTLEVPTLSGKARVKVPAGTQSGKRLRLRGKGMPRVQRSGRGDQYVRLQIETPQKLTDRQRELLTEFEQISSELRGEDHPQPKRRSFLDALKEFFE